MGTIRVGQKNPRRFESGNLTRQLQEGNMPGGDIITEKRDSQQQKVMNEEEKAKFMESLKQLPKDKWVPALRNAGLEAEANECEKALADEQLYQENLEKRAKRLAEIKAMDEEEQLPLLLEEGFDEEAKELSEKLALNGEASSTTEEGSEEPENAGEDNDEEPEPSNDGEAPIDSEAEKQEEKNAAAKKGRKSSKK